MNRFVSDAFRIAFFAAGFVATCTAFGQTAISAAPPAALRGATVVSPLSGSKLLTVTVALAPADRAAMAAYADAVSNPRSPEYHRFLSPAQVGERFGPSQATYDSLVNYLKSKKLTIKLTTDSHLVVVAQGKVSDLQTAFSTKLNNYRNNARLATQPKTFYSYATTPKLPSAIAMHVVTVQGLDNANPPVPATSALRPQDCRNVYSSSSIYDGGFQGQGINIGVSNFDGYRISNASVYGSQFGLPAPAGGYGSNITKKNVGGVDGETVNEGAEGDLDFQMVLANAPLCNLFIYDGIGGGLIATLAQEVQDNLVDVVTESYGFGAGDDFYLAAHDQHMAMTLQGITYMGASGDTGTSWLLSVPYPGFDPDVLVVGGSDVTLDALGGRGSELGWNGSGSGWYTGGVAFNVLPPYQHGTTVPTGINHRMEPDIALHATNWFFSFGNSIGNVGGTSAATPSFAGQLGIIIQKLAANDAIDVGSNGRPRLGRIQDFIYGLDGDPTTFFDISGGDAGVLPDGTESVGKPGWDFVTGWGAPIDDGLYAAYLAASSVPLTEAATTAAIYQIANPTFTLGTSPEGDASGLADSGGGSYSVESVRQAVVGQVAAAAINVQLQTEQTRRSASLSVRLSSPSLTGQFVYLLNKDTHNLDLVSTVTSKGAMDSITVPIDVSASGHYIQTDGTVSVVVRALLPQRLGNTPFRLNIDQVVVNERVARGS